MMFVLLFHHLAQLTNNATQYKFVHNLCIMFPALAVLETEYSSPILSNITAANLESAVIPGWEKDDIVASFLRRHPSITALTTLPRVVGDPSIDITSNKNADQVYLPHLQTLTIQSVDRIASLITGGTLDLLHMRDRLGERTLPTFLGITKLELRLAMADEASMWALWQIQGVRALNLMLNRGCTQTSLLSIMTRPQSGKWLFPDLAEFELCFTHGDTFSTTGPGPKFDFRLVGELISARRKSGTVSTIQVLTFEKQRQEWKWEEDYVVGGGPRPKYRYRSPLSPKMKAWFAGNVETFRLESG